MINNRVSIVRRREATYEPDLVEAQVRESLDLIGGMRTFVRSGQQVLVKPNLLKRSSPEEAIVTHPTVVRAVVRVIQEAGGIVTIGDSPGGIFTPHSLRELYNVTGLQDVANETGAILNFNTATERFAIPDGHLSKAVDVASFALEADVIISLPKWKTHELMGFTGATKNLFGLVPGVTKAFYHAKMQDAEQFADMLLDLLGAFKPALSLMDAIVGMHGNGPSAGDPFPIGCILCSTNPVSLDLVATGLAGLEPQNVIPLRRAIHYRMTSGSIDDIEIVGTPLEQAMVRGFRPASSGMPGFGSVPRFLRRLAIRHLVASPQPTEHCIACGICIQNCPVNAIRPHGSGIRIDLGKCIRCYCCHELCPERAIHLGRPLLGRLIR